jgi:hypothetical protein
MVPPTRIFDAGKLDEISEYLSGSIARQAVFGCSYRGGNRPKSAEDIASVTKLTKVRVLQVATPMEHKGYVIGQKENGKKYFLKQKDLVSSRDRILRLARNRKRLKALADAKLGKLQVTVKVHRQSSIRVDAVTIDLTDNFSKVRKIRATDARLRSISPKRLKENIFKYGFAKILGDQGSFTDWGGEKNDLYSDFVSIGGKRVRTAVAFKGVATQPPLTLKKLGKNADQIPRLFDSAAENFLVQFEGQVSEAVVQQMETYAIRKSKDSGKLVRFGVIGAEDSYRLRIAYPKSFALP